MALEVIGNCATKDFLPTVPNREGEGRSRAQTVPPARTAGLSFANTSMHAGQASSSFAPPKPALAPVSTAIHQTLAEVLSAQSQAMGPMASMRPSACMPSGTYAERFFAMLDDDQDDEEEATG